MKGRGWLYGYGVTAAIHLAAIAAGWDTVRFISKPMLMVVLLVWFWVEIGSKNYWIMSALFFSWLGDIFLMTEGGSGFIAGLSSFLLAHACYVIFFLFVRRRSAGTRKWNIYILVAVAIYVAGFNYYLQPSLDVALKIPVLVYSLVIGTMFIAVFHSSPRGKGWHTLAVTGSLLFIISDSFLAVNTFLQPFSQADLLIMLTYILAQAFIASGAAIWLRTAHKS